MRKQTLNKKVRKERKREGKILNISFIKSYRDPFHYHRIPMDVQFYNCSYNHVVVTCTYQGWVQAFLTVLEA